MDGSRSTRDEEGGRADAPAGLPGRENLLRGLRSALARRAAGDSEVAALVVDLDSFGEINSLLGHTRGDLILETVGARLRSRFRETDTVARLEGDSFGIACEARGLASVLARIIGRVEEIVSEPIAFGDGELVVGASVGAAVASVDHDPERLLAEAHAAVDEHKGRAS